MSRKLTLDDIADARAYERERDHFRASVIELKRRRRVSVGPLVTFVFENRETVRFQVQEMARAERIHTDLGIQAELDIYNPLVPEAGNLSATMFLELRSESEVRDWLPRLVGIEQAVQIVVDGGAVVCGVVDPAHASQLTRDHVTAAVHYVSFRFDQATVKAFTQRATLRIDHAAYRHEVALPDEVRRELLTDLHP